MWASSKIKNIYTQDTISCYIMMSGSKVFSGEFSASVLK